MAAADPPALPQSEIDQRESALPTARALLPRSPLAQIISFTDPRIKARYVTYRR